ncbi:MAG: hypothetical protein O7B79_09075 [SAR324 cluster bacterium]|nr:hypothetical protein [SAR324 cluster bacterium]MCZ6728870.1 hypothetical protein [SAR324 cluster bacterium]
MPRTAIILAGLALASALTGCSADAPAPPSAAMRAGLGKIGAASPGPAPAIRLLPIPGGKVKTAASGAGAALASSFTGCLDVDPTGICALATLFLSPYIATGGAIYGTAVAKPEQEVHAAQRAIAAALAGPHYQPLLLQRFVEEARTRAGGYTLLPLREGDLPRAGGAWNYAALIGLGLDSVLELRIVAVSLGRKPMVNPPLHLRIKARVRLLNLHDRSELYSKDFTHQSSQALEFLNWAQDDARPLREALNHGLQRLAGEIVTTLFLASG